MTAPVIKPLAFWSNHSEAPLPPHVVRTVTSRLDGQYALPTEVVLQPGARPTRMRMGRYWHLFEGKAKAWTHLLEVFEDHGQDGHTQFCSVGYAQLSDAQLEAFLNAARSCDDQRDFPRIASSQ